MTKLCNTLLSSGSGYMEMSLEKTSKQKKEIIWGVPVVF